MTTTKLLDCAIRGVNESECALTPSLSLSLWEALSYLPSNTDYTHSHTLDYIIVDEQRRTTDLELCEAATHTHKHSQKAQYTVYFTIVSSSVK